MIKKNLVTWQELYNDWNAAIRELPELRGQTYCRRVYITKPKFGPIYYFDWVPKADEEAAVQADVEALASGWPEVGASWSRGTIKTADLLASCETEEEFSAVWLCAFALSLSRNGTDWNVTKRNAADIEREACAIIARKYGWWHTSSRVFFPQFYIPADLLWESKDLSISTLVELAAVNAALVMAHFTPVEYKLV